MNRKPLAIALVALVFSLALLGCAIWSWVDYDSFSSTFSVSESTKSDGAFSDHASDMQSDSRASSAGAASASVSSASASSGEKANSEDAANSEETRNSKEGSDSELASRAEKALLPFLEKDEAARLIKLAKTDEDAAWIVSHPNAYKQYGAELQEKLLKLAADDPLAVPFVRNYPKLSHADEPNFDAPAMDEHIHAKGIPETAFPHLYQWDLRWGYTNFSQDGFGLAGCGPTALTIVYQGLTGNKEISPYDMGRLAEDGGYVDYDQGSMPDLFLGFASQLGLTCWEAPVSSESIKLSLEAGYPVIANVGPGRFSKVGHFFVLAGLSEDGMVVLNDPYSPERSSKLWDPEVIASESQALYVYSYDPYSYGW